MASNEVISNIFVSSVCLSVFQLTSAWSDDTRVKRNSGEMLMDDNSIATMSRPGTSLKAPGTGHGGASQGVR